MAGGAVVDGTVEGGAVADGAVEGLIAGTVAVVELELFEPIDGAAADVVVVVDAFLFDPEHPAFTTRRTMVIALQKVDLRNTTDT